ncbi:Leucine-rich repeat domain, L domain-like [Cinara cedri]|uniref:Leucine-rich repeat domain, L domain-like n=1 Tax=Cinara cedri TaxID=506608 RepID=A0A5E4MYS9_9HEMI|nr:Leucine-rich repeat domain, L domain-like [Cinara cedri]
MYASQQASPPIDNMDNSTDENPHVVPKNEYSLNQLVSINIDCVSNLVNPKELLIKGPTEIGIKLLLSPELTFSCLTKLKTLSLTSIKSFPENIFKSLGTISTTLEILEIGDCEFLPDDFPKFLKQLINLRSLRLENCYGRWEKFSKESFEVIRSLKHLKKLELINIEFNVELQLEKCHGITALLIIPIYASQSAATNCHLLECLEKLSKTLTHVVWGLTKELLRVTDLFIKQYSQNRQNRLNLGYNIDMPETKPYNNIPILRSKIPKPQPEGLKTTEIDKEKSNNINMLSVPALRDWLDLVMINANTKVIKIPYSATTRVYLSVEFDNL